MADDYARFFRQEITAATAEFPVPLVVAGDSDGEYTLTIPLELAEQLVAVNPTPADPN